MRRKLIIAIPLIVAMCIAGLVLMHQFARQLRIPLRSSPGISMAYQVSDFSGRPADQALTASAATRLQEMIDPDALIDLTITLNAPGQIEIMLPDPPADSQPSAAGIRELLSQAGALEFNIVVADPAGSESVATADRLRERGPAPEADDRVKWVEASGISGISATSWNGRPYLLVHTTPEHSLMHGRSAWQLNRAYPVTAQNDSRGVGFELDEQGGRLFGQLTGSHVGQLLAAVVNGRAISVATLQGQITRYGILSLNDTSQANVWKTVRALNAGSLPARLSPQPISQRPVQSAHYLNLGLQLTYLLIAVTLGLAITWAILLLFAVLAHLNRERAPISA